MKLATWLIIMICTPWSSYCQAPGKSVSNSGRVLKGIYRQKNSNKYLEILANGSYILHWKPVLNSHLVLERCPYISKGLWNKFGRNVLQLTSENYYQKQPGFEYELKKERKWSGDSLYIKINLPEDFTYFRRKAVNFVFYFNTGVTRHIITDSAFIKVAKNKYLDLEPNEGNAIDFSVDAKVAGTGMYRSRVSFEIFHEDIDTKKANFLTITLPNFDLCFFEFEPVKQELVFVKNTNELIWKGENWIRQ